MSTENTENTIWIPQHEYEMMKAWEKSMTEEQKRRTEYFFWNNFSMDGYEEALKNGEITEDQPSTKQEVYTDLERH